jgi:hypothetical protein
MYWYYSDGKRGFPMLATAPTMPGMARKTTSGPGSSGPQPGPRRRGHSVMAWVDADIFASLHEFIAAQRVPPSITNVVELALQEFLQREGHYPPKTKRP